MDRQVQEIKKRLKGVNEIIKPYQLAYVSLKQCVFLEKNAHFMSKDKLDRLANNIKEDGFLSQLPFAMRFVDDTGEEKFRILSGNHRVKASIIAKLEYILILYVDEISKDKQLAYQLSHNELVGNDDLQILKELYEGIENLNMKEFSAIDELKFAELKEITPQLLPNTDIDMTDVKFMFVQSKKNMIEDVIRELDKLPLEKIDGIIYGSFEEFVKCLTGIKEKYGIKSKSVAFMKMIDICNKELSQNESI